MKHNFTFKQRFQYYFDKAIGRGTFNLLILIALITTVIVALIASLLWLGIVPSAKESGDYPESFWRVLRVTLNPAPPDEGAWTLRLILLLMAVIGILIVSTLIGVLTAGIEAKFESLRRGRSFVIENGHIVILGWSSKIYVVLEELSCANENQRNVCVAILADRDKVSMEEDISSNMQKKLSITVVCRTGNPTRISDLKIVNPTSAKSIIVLQDTNSQSDSTCLKTCLALMNIFGGDITCPVAVEMQYDRSVDALLRIDSDIQAVRSGNIISRVLVQASRQPGLSDVYDEILSFHGCEIYFFPSIKVVGCTVGEAVVGLQNCSLIGLLSNDKIVLNPPANRTISNTDKLIVISEDDTDIEFNKVDICFTEIIEVKPNNNVPENVLIVGWNNDANIFLTELQNLLPKGSSLVLMFDESNTCGPDGSKFKSGNTTLEIKTGDTASREFLNCANLEIFNHIVVLGYTDSMEVDEADGESLLTLIQLRDLIKSNGSNVNIACELLNTHNRELVATEKNEDYIACEDLVAKNLVQIAENENIERVFKILLTADDSEFHMRSVNHYLGESRTTKYEDIVSRGLELGEIVVGYRKESKCTLNPEKYTELTFSKDDSIIVLAED